MKTFFGRLFGAFAALLLLFEEWGWVPLQRAAAYIARLPPLAWAERRIAQLPPYGALAVFALPALGLLPVKLAALWAIAHGHALLGMGVIVAAKLAGTAMVARLFSLTQPALMRLAWFARAYTRFTAWKDEVFARIRASWAWRAGRAIRRRTWQRWRQRWGASHGGQ